MKEEWRIIAPLAYQGKAGCTSVICTRGPHKPGEPSQCWGWHCSYCDEPCSSQGHSCAVGRILIDEARRIDGER